MLSHFFPRKCESSERLDGKTVVITGCNTGIGKHNAMDFCMRGARVVMACRSTERAEKAKEDILKALDGKENLGTLAVVKLDLSSLSSVRSSAKTILEQEPRIDILVNNAGVMCSKELTEDGFEKHMGTNHLGHFLFTLLLLPTIIKSAPAKIINLSSSAHKWGDTDFEDYNFEKTNFNPRRAYGRSKLANILFTKELARRLEGRGVSIYAVHPGVVRTELGRHVDEMYFKGLSTIIGATCAWMFLTPEQGAQTTMYCAVDKSVDGQSGLYYSNCRVTEPSDDAKNMDLAKKLWDLSLKLVKVDDIKN